MGRLGVGIHTRVPVVEGHAYDEVTTRLQHGVATNKTTHLINQSIKQATIEKCINQSTNIPFYQFNSAVEVSLS